MKYVGSKNRLAKELVPIIESYITDETEWYIEPFVGGANVIDKISFLRKIGSDNNEYLIELLKYVQDLSNPLPETITEEEYNKVKENKEDYPKWYVGLVGFGATFGSKWFGGFARGRKTNGEPRDYANESIRNLKAQRSNLKDIVLQKRDFTEYKNVKNSVIYCDIPYRNTVEYKDSKVFDYELFYEWCKEMKNKGNVVLVSEYEMPEGFTCIWEKEHRATVQKNKKQGTKRVERLFIVD